MYFQLFLSVLLRESLAALRFFITSEGSNTYAIEIIGLNLSRVLNVILGIAKLIFGRGKEDYQTRFLSVDQLDYIFNSHEGPVFDRSISQFQDYSDACCQSIPGPSPLTSSKKTDTGTQTEDCFGPVLANLEDKLAANQNMCSELQQKISSLEKQLERSEEENHKLQADLGRYLFLEEKGKRMSAMTSRGHELLGHLVSGGVTTDYDNNPPDSTVSVMNQGKQLIILSK